MSNLLNGLMFGLLVNLFDLAIPKPYIRLESVVIIIVIWYYDKQLLLIDDKIVSILWAVLFDIIISYVVGKIIKKERINDEK
nr:MAG TPA: hypothetical protein [Caudoviricetes sp.]